MLLEGYFYNPPKAVVTIILFVTISAGIKSKTVFPGLYIFFKIPRAASKVRPPAAARESVHPGVGYLLEQAMIEGRKMIRLMSPLFFKSYFSAKFFVNV